jgi:hypothetical protein
MGKQEKLSGPSFFSSFNKILQFHNLAKGRRI